MSIGPVVDSRAVKRAQESDVSTSPTSGLRSEAESGNSNDSIYLQEISEKAFVVCGNTMSLKAEFKAINGKWMPSKSAWMFSKKRLAEVAKIAGVAPEMKAK